MLAISHENINIVYALIERGADVNLRSNSGHSVLTYAFDIHNMNIINALIEAGADDIKKNSAIDAYMRSSRNPPRPRNVNAPFANISHELRDADYIMEQVFNTAYGNRGDGGSGRRKKSGYRKKSIRKKSIRKKSIKSGYRNKSIRKKSIRKKSYTKKI